MADVERPLSPHLQVYRWQITMVLSILHRATGLAMSIGIVLLILWLTAAASGPEPFTRLRELLATPPGLVVVAGLVFSFCYHLCNGVRHLFWDAGLGFEKAQYYASGWSVVGASIVLTAATLAIGSGLIGGGA